MQGMRKDFTRVRPPPQYSVDEAPKAAGSSHPPYSPVEPSPPAKAQTSQINDTTAPQASKAHATASAALRPGIVSNPSSEYATTDTEEDYDSWASEGISDVDAAGTSTGKRPSTEEIRRREPALEAQRLREPFPYLNPGRAQTGKTDGALQAPNARATASAASRRGIVSYSSSEYETSDTEDDDDWASDGVSVDAAGTSTSKRPPTKEARLRGAALEARRWRELFVKQPKPLSEHPVASDHDVTSTGLPSALTPSKSPAAPPLAAHVSAQAPIKTTITPSIPGGYRPKGHLQGDELEDESDDPDEVIQDSHSLAQQRLAAPAAGPFRRRASDNQVPTTTQTSPTMVAMEPMSFSHASDLPVPAPPATPRTTRRQMLATEFSESLRRNLLWERQVSKTKLANTGRRNELGGGGGGGGSRLVTTVVDESGNAQAVPPPPQQQQQHAQGSGDEAQESIVESGQRVLTRN